MAMFVGQVAAESGFKIQEEDLNYTHASRLVEVYPHEFPTEASTAGYVGNPTALANRVYANRLGNGDEASGDGWTFRGVGLIQLTGRTNFTLFGKSVGKSPEEAATYCLTQEGAALSAAWYWDTNKLNDLADLWEVTLTTKKINGSTEDAARRVGLCNAAYAAIEALPSS
jgi:putative chitinase